MSFIRKVYELFGGNSGRIREKLCAILQSYGVEVRLAEKKRPEEKIGSDRGRFISGFGLTWVSGGDSLGIIELNTGIIRWINILSYQFGDSSTDYWYIYGIPFPGVIPVATKIHIKASEVRKRWLGPAVGVKWEGNDSGLGIIEWLNRQESITELFFALYKQGIRADLEIDTEPGQACWTLAAKIMPSREMWHCYQTIAGQLQRTTFPG